MSTATQAKVVGSRSRGQWAMWTGLALVVGLGMLFYGTVTFGLVQGEEFSPQQFARREFHYYQLPWLGWQISPVTRRTTTNAFETYLATEKLIGPLPPPADDRWDLVLATQGSVPGSQRALSQGSASILCAYLDSQRDGKDFVWLEWSKRHPELARVVWPTIVRLAREDLYLFIPAAIRAARSETTVESLQASLSRAMAREYLDFARAQQRLGKHDAAVELYSGAIDFDPESALAFQGRAESLVTLGQADRASADLAQAKKFERR